MVGVGGGGFLLYYDGGVRDGFYDYGVIVGDVGSVVME